MFPSCVTSHPAIAIPPLRHMTEVTVQVPDGVYEGMEFTLEYEGTALSVVCPAGCGPGDEINLQIDVPPGGGAAPQSVQVVVPDGCYAGSVFTVEFDGTSFDITVPDGCGPGMEITVDVPNSAPQGLVVTDEMIDEAHLKASRMGNKPDADVLRWALNTYWCAAAPTRRTRLVRLPSHRRSSASSPRSQHNGDIEATFAAMGDDPAEALNKPTYCDTPAKFAANYVLGYFKVRQPAPAGQRAGAARGGGGMVVTNEMYDDAVSKASRMGNKPDADVLRWALNTYWCARRAPVCPCARAVPPYRHGRRSTSCCRGAAKTMATSARHFGRWATTRRRRSTSRRTATRPPSLPPTTSSATSRCAPDRQRVRLSSALGTHGQVCKLL
jgi:hypothetical protein